MSQVRPEITNRALFLKELRSDTHKQLHYGIGYYAAMPQLYKYHPVCAYGLILRLFPETRHLRGPGVNPAACIGLDLHQFGEMISINDNDGKTFPQIADWIETLPITISENPDVVRRDWISPHDYPAYVPPLVVGQTPEKVDA